MRDMFLSCRMRSLSVIAYLLKQWWLAVLELRAQLVSCFPILECILQKVQPREAGGLGLQAAFS